MSVCYVTVNRTVRKKWQGLGRSESSLGEICVDSRMFVPHR